MYKFGDWAVWPLNDGYLDIDQRLLFSIQETKLKATLDEVGQSCIEDFLVRTQVNAYLIDTGKHLILVDTGCGIEHGSTAGALKKQIEATGHALDAVSLVLITHLHSDHIGGLVSQNGMAVFPKATICMSRVDLAYWTSYDQEVVCRDCDRPFFELVRKVLPLYEGRIRELDDKEMVISGVQVIKAFGHTPGHIGFLFSSKDEQLLLWGDIVHSLKVQFAYPDLCIEMDIDPKEGVRSRKDLLERVAGKHILIGGGHLPLPSLGYVSKKDKGFTWAP
jgi:glyoxylase-like metal-dependent hydrolase (beta-lactamase superfamily II)